jgi:TPR repeat protein
MIENGRGIARNLEEAVTWYQRAARQGNVGAQQTLRRLNRTW